MTDPDDDDELVAIVEGEGRTLSRTQFMVNVTWLRNKAAVAPDAAIGCWLRFEAWSAANFTKGLIPGGATWSARELTARVGTSPKARSSAIAAGLLIPSGDDLRLARHDDAGDLAYLRKVRAGIESQRKRGKNEESEKDEGSNATSNAPSNAPGTAPGTAPSNASAPYPYPSPVPSPPVQIPSKPVTIPVPSCPDTAEVNHTRLSRNEILAAFKDLVMTDNDDDETQEENIERLILLCKERGEDRVREVARDLKAQRRKNGQNGRPWPREIQDVIDA